MNPDFVKLTGFQILVFLFFFILVMTSRNSRLHNSLAFEVSNPTEIFLNDLTELSEVTEILLNADLEFQGDEFVWAAQTLGWRRFRPGRYLLSGSYSYQGLLSKLARGLQDPVSVTILPGSDPGRLSLSLSRQLRADSLSFALVFSDDSSLVSELEMMPLELFSRMLPNTYEMFWTSAPEAVVRRLLSEFDRAVTYRFFDGQSDSPLSLSEVITLASIVEWEARFDHEKPRIAGLYLNRLERGMMLQADPTVAFALGERRRLLFEDYRIDHPFNTYRITGLPPAPITNPSLTSILAVLNPEEHSYLYMVATPEGTHRFSRTFEEHRIASDEWRRWLREQLRIRRERESRGEDPVVN
ncbi:MAG: endolytic transglycosylase MltG [Balneolaceae bacterium]|nr:MAG: endolytic transglycosylase MltG [Balneolaceae bacterium]